MGVDRPRGKILVIDDDPALQRVLEIALSDASYRVITASNGQQAIDQLAHTTPDLILSDIMMPGMDGVQMFRAIQDKLQGENIPIIIMTALNRKPWFDDLEAEGAVIIQKPFQIDELIRLIDTMLI